MPIVGAAMTLRPSKWIPTAPAATATLVLYSLASAFISQSGANSPWIRILNPHALSLIVCAWILTDARQRRRPICYDFDTFLFFAWPLLAPIYLFQTRRYRALLPMLGFVAIWLGGHIIISLAN